MRRELVAVAMAVSLAFGLLLSSTDAKAAVSAAQVEGRPRIKLDRLSFPPMARQKAYERHLRERLAREARRADWGAGQGSVIEYRFFVDKLAFEEGSKALTVRCSALGRLPKGKSARTQIAYSGRHDQREQLVRQVLDIVARGVITRLAELERARRSKR